MNDNNLHSGGISDANKLWIARDADGDLYIYPIKPYRSSNYWDAPDEYDYYYIDRNLFPSLKWEDEPKLLVLSDEPSSCGHENGKGFSLPTKEQFDEILRMNTEVERRHIATKMMAALIYNLAPYHSEEAFHQGFDTPQSIAQKAVEYADALIAELNKPRQ